MRCAAYRWRVKRGEFVAVMGPSGSGKSTMMNIIGCLDRLTSGTYILDGIDVSTMSKNDLADTRNTKIGFVFQSFNLIPRTTALCECRTSHGVCRTGPAVRRERARQALASVGLAAKERQSSEPAFRRPATARGSGPRHRQRPGADSCRRTDRRAGYEDCRRNHGDFPAAESGAGNHDRARHARSRTSRFMRCALVRFRDGVDSGRPADSAGRRHSHRCNIRWRLNP